MDFILDTYFGDSGKSRIADLLAKNYNVFVKCCGGSNGGHTVLVDNTLLKLHLIPSSVLHRNVKMVMGSEMVINIEKFKKEVLELKELGIDVTPDNLAISELAHIVTQSHIDRDIASEESLGKNKIGTTKQGIGPCVIDKYSRIGIRLKDAIENQSNSPDIDFISPYVTDTRKLLLTYQNLGYSILAESSQGTGLDISYGLYPYVTCGDTLVYGCLKSMGIGVKNIGKIIGVTKSFGTRVGTGPLLGEIFDNELLLRLRGEVGKADSEFGVTSGRPRRIGWLDASFIKFSVELNSITEIALTKLDILSGLDKVKIYIGNDKDSYIEFPGWNYLGTSWNEFPQEAKNYVEAIENYTEVPIHIISIGPERNSVVYK
jgi:adenylosuccinate synthase